MAKPTIQVRIITPKELIFQGSAYWVSSTNSQGPFDVLPQHANFVTLIENKPIKVKTPDKKILTYTFQLAILYARADSVNIYTDIQIYEDTLVQEGRSRG